MALSDNQRRRLDERLAVLRGSLSEQQYLMHLQSASGAAELSTLISVVAVHKTDLFRDEVQLGDFRTQVLVPLVAKSAGRPLRFWSAGCATGEEVATLLMMLDEAGADPGSSVLGTDISEAALNRARTLSFSAEQVRRLPAVLRERYFMPDGSRSLLVPELRERANFHLHNLMETPYPTAGGNEGFDVIFCRNVLIYFTAEAFERVVLALAERLAPGGTLVLSAAEPLLQAPPSLRVIRSEHAFFYVRTPNLLAAPSSRHLLTGGGASEPFSSGLERRRDAGAFPVVAPSAPSERPREQGAAPPQPPPAPAPEWPKETGAPPGPPPTTSGEPRRDSGRYATVPGEPRRDSGRYATVGTEPRRDSGRYASVPGEPRRESGSYATVPGEPRRDSGRYATVGTEPRRDSGRYASVPGEPRRDSGSFATVAPEPRRESGSHATVSPEPRRDSGRHAAVPSGSWPAGSPQSGSFPAVMPSEGYGAPDGSEEHPLLAEADSLFAQVLDGVGETDSQTEDYLRRCLALDPDLSAARYLLGMLLELREAFAEAASEYRRALRSLEDGRARHTPFFLNHSRLRVACAKAIERMEGGGKPR